MRFLFALVACLVGAGAISAPAPFPRPLKLPFTLKGHTGIVCSVAISPDGKRIVSGSADKTVKVWDAIMGQELLTLRGHKTYVSSLAISPDGRRIVSGGGDLKVNTVKVWDTGTGQNLLTLKATP